MHHIFGPQSHPKQLVECVRTTRTTCSSVNKAMHSMLMACLCQLDPAMCSASIQNHLVSWGLAIASLRSAALIIHSAALACQLLIKLLDVC